jgi:hypothetical protein
MKIRVGLALCLLPLVVRAAAVALTDDGTGFSLVHQKKAAPIVVSENAPEVVRIAAKDFAADVERVTGIRPDIVKALADNKGQPRVEFVIAPELAGRWEAFRISATKDVLTVAGSDRRGLAYGIYELSRRIGVSPWYWWADVPAQHRDELCFSIGEEPIDQPAVRYRGIFINDEDWGLVPWAAKTFEPEVGNLGPKTYSRIFELLLRLRANTIWPGMHECTTPFFKVPGNATAADKYAIVLGSSHAEPMLRSNVGEWTAPKDHYNYIKYRDEVLAYWEKRVKERTSGESLFTIGMRGIHDSGIVGPKTQSERISTVEKIFADQRDLLACYIGKGDPTKVAQVFCPYKEVLADYEAGLRVPDDATILWPDDNFGYIRRLPTAAERARAGGGGIYYHLSYLGGPLAWLWVDTMPLSIVWSEMMRAYEHNAKTLWIVNVGDIKNTERSTEFFLDLAWHADRTSPDAPARFIYETAARDFGADNADAVADLIKRLQKLSMARKPEHLQWFLSLTPYKPTELNEAEIEQRLKECSELLRDSEALAKRLAVNAQDAYYQLIDYPIAATEGANERYFRSELARADVARNRSPKANLKAASDAERRIAAATAFYNDKVAKGKWRNIVTSNGVAAKSWRRNQADYATERPAPALDNVAPPAPKEPAKLPTPASARLGDFVERDGVVSICAGNFGTQNDQATGAGWRVIPGLGRTGSAVTVLPSTAKIGAASAPALSYRFHVAADGRVPTIHVRLLPTYPIAPAKALRFALRIDGGKLQPFAVTKGFDTKKDEWKQRVLSNATETSLKLTEPLAAGWHTLQLVAVDTGVVVDKIVIDLGGLHPSYDGPAETRISSE